MHGHVGEGAYFRDFTVFDYSAISRDITLIIGGNNRINFG